MKILSELFQLGLAVALNTLIGIFNNMECGEKFSWKKLKHGLCRAVLFVVSLIGVVYIAEESKLLNDSAITPEGILQAGILFYTSKVLLALKTMLLPNNVNGLEQKENLYSEEDLEVVLDAESAEEFTAEDFEEFEVRGSRINNVN